MDILAEQNPSRAEAALRILSDPALDLVFRRPTRIGVQSAWYGHVPFAFWLVDAVAPRSIVELGTHNGVSYAAFCEAAALTRSGARCMAVDTWEGDEHAGSYGAEVLDELRRFHDPRYGSFSELMRCTFDEARPFVPESSVDLLHIDGLHTYEAVRHDWEHWRPTLSDRGVVLFHDINEHQGSFGVWRLWEELRRAHPSFTFLHGHGLGVLAPAAIVPEAVRGLCELGRDPQAASRIRERFSLLGERWDAHSEHQNALAMRRDAEAANAGLRGDVARLRSLGDAFAEAQARTAAAEREIVRLDALNEKLGFGLEQTRVHERRLSSELGQAVAERDRLRGDVAFRASEWERIHQVMAVRDADRADLQRRLDMVARSVWWRLGGPFRRLDRALPGIGQARRKVIQAARLAATGALGRHRAMVRQRRAEIAALRRSTLFDAAFYRARHPDLAASADPAEHYAWVGVREGAFPNPAFDTEWYLARNPGLTGTGENPLLHWQRVGAASGQDPGPLFDARWYAGQHPEAAADPLLHYLTIGAGQDLDPNPILDAEAYRLEYADVRQSGLGALEHWVRFGNQAGLNPHPLFDTAWYRDRHGLPHGGDALAHWMQIGRHRNLPVSAAMERNGRVWKPLAFAAEPDPAVSIIIPVWGHYADTVRCLDAVMTNSGDAVRFEVLVADDNPDLRVAPLLDRRATGLRTHENDANLGFLLSCNRAAGRARGRVLVFLNNDTLVRADWLAPILSLFDQRPDAGMIGGKLLGSDGIVQEAGGSIGSDGWGIPYGAGGDPDDPDVEFVREVDVVTGACLAVRREAWDAAGGFDETFAPAFYEEFDLAFAMRKRGWRVLYQPACVVDHLGSNSYGEEMRDRQSVRNHARFCKKWSFELRTQPAPDAAPLRLRSRPHDGRTILFIDDRVPEWDRHAGALTNRQYIELWQTLGFQVVFAPAADPRPSPPYTDQLRQMGVEILHPPGSLDAWLTRHGGAVDLIWTARPDVTAPLLPLLRERSSAPILYYPHDLHHVRERRRWELEGNPAALEASERYRWLERRIFGQVDRVLAISTGEAAVIRDLAPSADVRIIPPYLYPAPPAPPTPDAFALRDAVLFVGGYVHPPNVDAARFLATEIMPLVWHEEPAITLILAGSSPTAVVSNLAGPHIEVPGFLPDLGPAYERARIGVSPLRYGAGVKGKMVEALWRGLPIVCTTIANEGLDLVDGEEAIVADDAREFARRLVALWRDAAACAAMAAAGQAVVRKRFTRDAASSLMTGLAAAGRRPATMQRETP